MPTKTENQKSCERVENGNYMTIKISEKRFHPPKTQEKHRSCTLVSHVVVVNELKSQFSLNH